MKIEVFLTHEPIVPPPEALESVETGAVAEFSGIVRASENGAPIAGLIYEAYEPMAHSEMIRILRDLAVKNPCHSAWVTHRLGRVTVGESAIHIRITSSHRREAFALLSTFLDQLKIDVPIWKSPLTS